MEKKKAWVYQKRQRLELEQQMRPEQSLLIIVSNIKEMTRAEPAQLCNIWRQSDEDFLLTDVKERKTRIKEVVGVI
jgi:hypothetical protein